jgi:aldehyde dehydrogenase (NAD+)
MEPIVQTLRKTFNSNVTKSLKWRIKNLNSLLKMIEENTEELCAATKKDLNKHSQETVSMELGIIKNGIIFALNNLEEWVKPQNTTPLSKAPLFSTLIENQPYGVVFIIGAWNYPYQVCLVPLVGAIAR